MKQKCLGCGVEKDSEVLEMYLWSEDMITTDEPVAPLFVLECQPDLQSKGKTWKMVVVCHKCMHELQPDMWISEGIWRALNPVTSFDNLPEYTDRSDKWNPASYRMSK